MSKIWFLIAMVAAPMGSARADAAPTRPCELHVWPAAGLTMLRARAYDNFMSGGGPAEGWGILPAIVSSRDQRFLEQSGKSIGERSAPSQGGPLDFDRQVALMEGMGLPALLGFTGYAVTFHRDAVNVADIRKSAPIAGAVPACRAELILANLNYVRVYAHGHNLKSLIFLRDFGSGTPAARRLGLAVETRLTGRAKEVVPGSAAFVDDLERAFAANVRQFAAKAALVR